LGGLDIVFGPYGILVFVGVRVIESSVIDKATAGRPVDVHPRVAQPVDVHPRVAQPVLSAIVSREKPSMDDAVGRAVGADTDDIVDVKLFAGV
jgi:hypothetical protein